MVFNNLQIRSVKLPFTTDGSGNATVSFESKDVMGTLYAVQLVDGDVADGVDLVLTCEQGDLSIPLLTIADWNTDQILYPRVLENLNTTGAALTTHTMPLVMGQPKAVIAQGGASKSGAVILYII